MTHKYRLMRPHSKLVDSLPGSYPEKVNLALSHYSQILAASKPSFEENEWNLIFDSCNGWLIDDEIETYRDALLLQIEDSIRINKLDAKWGCDRQKIIKKIVDCSLVECVCIVFEIKRFWEGDDSHR